MSRRQDPDEDFRRLCRRTERLALAVAVLAVVVAGAIAFPAIVYWWEVLSK